MTVIRPNSISGVSSITGQGGDISIFRADGTAADVTVNNITSGVITATTFSGGTINAASATITGNLGVGGTLTYEDVTNIDSVGIITARSGIDCNGTLEVSSTSNFDSTVKIADKIEHLGDSNTNIRFPAADTITAETGGSERLRIDSGGRILKGLTTARGNYGNNASGVEYGFQIEGTSAIAAGLSIVRNSNDANDGGIVLGKTRATSNGGNTVVQAGDDLGNLTFAGNDGSTMLFGAEIFAEVQSGVGNDDMPADLIFKTNGGSTSTTERMRISKEGYVTKPNLPTFCVRWNTGDAQNLNSGDIIIFTNDASATSRWNNGGHYSTTTGKFTAPVAGFYYFAGRVMTTGWSDGNDIQDLISIQSSAGIITYPTQRRSRFRSDADANGYYTTSISAQVQAASGATFWLQSNRNGNGSGWDAASAQYSFFTGWLIG